MASCFPRRDSQRGARREGLSRSTVGIPAKTKPKGEDMSRHGGGGYEELDVEADQPVTVWRPEHAGVLVPEGTKESVLGLATEPPEPETEPDDPIPATPATTDEEEPEPGLWRCRYCQSTTHRSSAWTTDGADVERFDRLHPNKPGKRPGGSSY